MSLKEFIKSIDRKIERRRTERGKMMVLERLSNEGSPLTTRFRDSIFSKKNPNSREFQILSSWLGLTLDQVKIWFQNHFKTKTTTA